MDYLLFDDPNTAKDAIMDFVFTPDFAKLDDDTKSHVKDCLKNGSVSFCSAYVTEWVFARMKTQSFPQSFVSLAAACGAYCLKYGVDNISGTRGAGILDALRRERGEPYPVTGGKWATADTDPDPRSDFVKSVEVAPPAVEAAPAPIPAPTPTPASPAADATPAPRRF